MKEALSHILDQSVCLTRRQMKEYIAGTMLREEQHAAELHLASCPLCSMAMDGFEAHSEEALAAIASLNSGFLKEHYDAVTPQIHLNSVAPVMTASAPRRKTGAQPLWRNLGIAASVVLALGVVWFMRQQKMENGPKAIADNSLPAASALAQPMAATAEKPASPRQQNERRPAAAGNTRAATVIAADDARKADASGEIAMTDKSAAPPVKPAATAASQESGASVNVPAVVSPSPDEGRANQRSKKGKDISVGGGRTSRNNVIVDGVQYQDDSYSTTVTTPKFKTVSKSPPVTGSRGYRNYNTASFPGASTAKVTDERVESAASAARFKNQMESSEGTRRSRHAAGIQSAKAYVAAGQKAKAIAVLNAIIAEGGPQKRAAKKMLKELQESYSVRLILNPKAGNYRQLVLPGHPCRFPEPSRPLWQISPSVKFRRGRFWRRLILFPLIVVAVAVFFIDYWVKASTKAQLYYDVAAIPHRKIGLLLGTSKFVAGGRINLYYKYPDSDHHSAFQGWQDRLHSHLRRQLAQGLQ